MRKPAPPHLGGLLARRSQPGRRTPRRPGGDATRGVHRRPTRTGPRQRDHRGPRPLAGNDRHTAHRTRRRRRVGEPRRRLRLTGVPRANPAPRPPRPTRRRSAPARQRRLAALRRDTPLQSGRARSDTLAPARAKVVARFSQRALISSATEMFSSRGHTATR